MRNSISPIEGIDMKLLEIIAILVIVVEIFIIVFLVSNMWSYLNSKFNIFENWIERMSRSIF